MTYKLYLEKSNGAYSELTPGLKLILRKEVIA